MQCLPLGKLMTIKNIRASISNQEFPAKKEAVLTKLKALFAKADADLAVVSATVKLSRRIDEVVKVVGAYQVDCMVSTADGKSYYFTFGYDRRQEVENPFFIWLNDSWFDGTELIAQERALYLALSQAMGHQGRFDDQGIGLKVSQLQPGLAA
ncbi:MAG: hypothetical protein QG574_2774 [Cyanobacteriota bacterium erpe_2018_sw_21hr_WHONDRS-SW48-000092_B_bin.40]|nr:hypothetical protein [Cyanobacteriota bacterium erpe_2018_sw_21hr_WHONDRS-SW48-000092_B_bin.40]